MHAYIHTYIHAYILIFASLNSSIYSSDILTCTMGINLTDNFRNIWKTAHTVYNCQKFRTVFPHVVTAGVYAWTGTVGSGKAAFRAATSAV